MAEVEKAGSERRLSRLASVPSVPIEVIASKTGLRKTTIFALIFNGLVALLGAAILYTNSSFFNSTLLESLTKATAGGLDVGRSELSNFLNQQLTVRGSIKWQLQVGRTVQSHLNRPEFAQMVVSVMQSRDTLATLYQGDASTLNVLKFEKQGAYQYYVELRNHSTQTRHRRTCAIAEVPDVYNSTKNVSCYENAVVSKSYDVRLKSWFEAGNLSKAITLQGPSFESYVVRDVNNPVSISIVFSLRLPAPSSDKVVYRLKVFIEKLRETYSRIDLGRKGLMFLVKTDGTIVLSKNRLDGIGTNSLGEAVFRNVRDLDMPLLKALTPDQLGVLSETETITVTLPGNNDVAAAIAPLIFSEPVDSPFRLIVVTHRSDFADSSIVYFETAKALGTASVVVAFCRTALLMYDAYWNRKRGKAVYSVPS